MCVLAGAAISATSGESTRAPVRRRQGDVSLVCHPVSAGVGLRGRAVAGRKAPLVWGGELRCRGRLRRPLVHRGSTLDMSLGVVRGVWMRANGGWSSWGGRRRPWRWPAARGTRRWQHGWSKQICSCWSHDSRSDPFRAYSKNIRPRRKERRIRMTFLLAHRPRRTSRSA